MDRRNIDGIDIFVNEKEKYLQLNDISDLSEAKWGVIAERYSGYDVTFCYHGTSAPVEFLAKIGAESIDDCVEMRLYSVMSFFSEAMDVSLIDETTFDEFALLHDERNPDMYWTSERIRGDFARWNIFALRNNNSISGYIMMAILQDNWLNRLCADMR